MLRYSGARSAFVILSFMILVADLQAYDFKGIAQASGSGTSRQDQEPFRLVMSYAPGGRMEVVILEHGSNKLAGMLKVGPGIDDKERSMGIAPGQYSIIVRVKLPEGGENYLRGGPFIIVDRNIPPAGPPKPLLMFSDYGPEIRCILCDLSAVKAVERVMLTPAEEIEFEKYSGGRR